VGMVTTSEHTIDVEPINVREGCPCSSIGHSHQLVRVKVVSTSLVCSVLLAGKLHCWHGCNSCMQ